MGAGAAASGAVASARKAVTSVVVAGADDWLNPTMTAMMPTRTGTFMMTHPGPAQQCRAGIAAALVCQKAARRASARCGARRCQKLGSRRDQRHELGQLYGPSFVVSVSTRRPMGACVVSGASTGCEAAHPGAHAPSRGTARAEASGPAVCIAHRPRHIRAASRAPPTGCRGQPTA